MPVVLDLDETLLVASSMGALDLHYRRCASRIRYVIPFRGLSIPRCCTHASCCGNVCQGSWLAFAANLLLPFDVNSGADLGVFCCEVP